jgi:CBS domain-containing protein
MHISDVLKDQELAVKTIESTEPLSAAIKALARTKVRSLVVMGGGSVVGMLTVRDVLARIDDRGADALALPVSEAMTATVTTVSSTTTLEDALGLFARHNINHLPVVDGGKLTGLVTPSDLLAHHLTEAKGLNDELVRYIHGSHAI